MARERAQETPLRPLRILRALRVKRPPVSDSKKEHGKATPIRVSLTTERLC